LFCGGASRRDSVLAGLGAIRDQARDDDWVLVHDAARPGLTAERLNQLIAECEDDNVGGLLAMPVADTLKRVSNGDVEPPRVGATVDRSNLWAAQTPQMFRYSLLVKALEAHPEATDEASAIEALGLSPRLVRGSMRNLKVTYPDDIALAATWLAAQA
jgi:2-C-methyl-D-erythritol 4-phosphate cytidylyltransferase